MFESTIQVRSFFNDERDRRSEFLGYRVRTIQQRAIRDRNRVRTLLERRIYGNILIGHRERVEVE